MRCPACVEANTPSRLYSNGGCYRTLMGGESPWWDWDGKYHSHDLNRSSAEYRCSNGHFWVVTSWDTCPHCDFNADKQTEWRRIER